jgi:phosphoribosylpyrophosphate synthetase
MTAIPLLISEIEKEYESIRHVTIAFPDDGAAKRFKDAFYNKGFPIVVCSKVRQGDKRVVQIKDRLNWPKSGSEAEKTALENVIIVDDLVQTGGTLNECRKALDSAGFQKVSAFATHAVFPLGAYRKFLKGGQFEGFHRFYVTDSVPETTQLLVHATENKDNNPFKVLSIASLIADDIVGYELLVDTSRQEIHVFVASNKMSKVRAVKRAYDN